MFLRGNSIFSTGEAALTKFIDTSTEDEVNIYLPNEETFAAFKETAAIYCVVSPGEIITVKRIIARYDKRAFISIMDVAEVTGEGFTYRVTKKRLFR